MLLDKYVQDLTSTTLLQQHVLWSCSSLTHKANTRLCYIFMIVFIIQMKIPLLRQFSRGVPKTFSVQNYAGNDGQNEDGDTTMLTSPLRNQWDKQVIFINLLDTSCTQHMNNSLTINFTWTLQGGATIYAQHKLTATREWYLLKFNVFKNLRL